MLNRYFILGVFLFFLVFFGIFIFWESNESSSSNEEKEIVWIDKPPFILLKDIKSKNPVLRREAIIKLGEKRSKRAVQPLFDIISGDFPLYEKQLAAKSIAMISSKDIIVTCLKILSRFQNEVSEDRLISILYILKSINISDIDLSKYDFSILNEILSQSNNNDVLINTIETIENLRFTPAFSKLATLYSKSLLYNITVLKAMTRLALSSPELVERFNRFLSSVILSAKHDDVKRNIRKALFTIAFQRYPDHEEFQIISLISDLSSTNFKKIIDAEKVLLSRRLEEKYFVLLRFFLSDLEPALVNRLLPVLIANQIPELKEDLKKFINNRYNTREFRDIFLDSSQIALRGLTAFSLSQEDVRFILNFIQDPFLGESAFLALKELYINDVEKVFIEQRLAGFTPFNLALTQKNQLYPFLDLLHEMGETQRMIKLINGAEPYVRYNTLNYFLKTKITRLPDELNWIPTSKINFFLSILKKNGLL